MHFFDSFRLLTILTLASAAFSSYAYGQQPEGTSKTLQDQNPQERKDVPSFEPFTGKITRNKVRVRLQPNLDGLILQELPKETLVSVVGEMEEFYAVRPLKETKAYVFRTLVLDNVVEGNKVNVRLEPALEAPVIAQLNNGDKVEGGISPLNSKWLEITPPESTCFYICKEYVEKIGSASLFKELEARAEEVNQLLKTAYLHGKRELQKNYADIQWNGVVAGFNKVINEYSDFSNQVARAKDLLAEMQKSYLQKKISYLEAQVSAINTLNQDTISYKEKAFLNAPETILREEIIVKETASQEALAPVPTEEELWNQVFDPTKLTAKMAAWVGAEKALYEKWAANQAAPSPYQFYQQEAVDQVVLNGMIEPYARTVRNKPGDYLLINQANNLPIAYLYSTKVNLQDKIGQQVSLRAVPRTNNNFAFPAYYVISLE